MEKSSLSKTDQPIKWILTRDISVIWLQSQRPWDSHAETAKNKIVANFDPDAFGVLQVTLPNGKGMYHCIDGQVRHRSVEEMWGDGQRVPCQVLNAKDPKRAAELFGLFNTSRSHVSAVHRFNVNVTAGYPDEVGCHKIITRLGYKAALDHEPDSIRAIGTCLAIYKQFGHETLGQALTTIKDTWGAADGAVEGAIIRGYGLFFATYGKQINRVRLIKRGKKQTPGQLLEDGRNLREMWKMSLGGAVSKALFEGYNRGANKAVRLTD